MGRGSLFAAGVVTSLVIALLASFTGVSTGTPLEGVFKDLADLCQREEVQRLLNRITLVQFVSLLSTSLALLAYFKPGIAGIRNWDGRKLGVTTAAAAVSNTIDIQGAKALLTPPASQVAPLLVELATEMNEAHAYLHSLASAPTGGIAAIRLEYRGVCCSNPKCSGVIAAERDGTPSPVLTRHSDKKKMRVATMDGIVWGIQEPLDCGVCSAVYCPTYYKVDNVKHYFTTSGTLNDHPYFRVQDSLYFARDLLDDMHWNKYFHQTSDQSLSEKYNVPMWRCHGAWGS